MAKPCRLLFAGKPMADLEVPQREEQMPSSE
jgi:hypothetical protein